MKIDKLYVDITYTYNINLADSIFLVQKMHLPVLIIYITSARLYENIPAYAHA